MKVIFNRTWVGNYIGTEETTLCQLDSYNKTRYSRRKKAGGSAGAGFARSPREAGGLLRHDPQR